MSDAVRVHLMALGTGLLVAAIPCGAADDDGLTLDSRRGYYETPHIRELDLRNEVTLAAWIRPDRLGRGGARIIDKSKAGTSTGYMLDTFPGNSLRMITAQGMARFDAKLKPGQWVHVAGVFSRPKGIFSLYIDGREVCAIGQADMKAMVGNRLPLRIGACSQGANRYRGRMGRASVFAAALSQAQIAALAGSRRAPLPAGVPCVGDWVLAADAGKTIPAVRGGPPLRRLRTPRTYGEDIMDQFGEQTVEFAGRGSAPDAPLSLWYGRPAEDWHEALPIGNGRLGAMVFGGVPSERIQFNEDSIWTGEPRAYRHEGAAAHLQTIRKLLTQGKQKEAEALAMREFMSVPLRQMAYQPCGDLVIHTGGEGVVTEYRRVLDLDTALATSTFKRGGVAIRREAFVSAPAQAIVVRVQADTPGALTLFAALSSPHANSEVAVVGSDGLRLTGGVSDGASRFEARLKLIADGGQISTTGDAALRIEGANAATFLLVGASNHRRYNDLTADPEARCVQALAALDGQTYQQLRAAHVADHQALFRRVSVDVGLTPAARKETDQRVRDFKQAGDDPALAALYMQYGRYLLIASSRAPGQPANLQGLWNDKLNPPWDSKYTVNINTEMNYWPAEVGALPECVAPLISMLEDTAETGAETARAHYGCGGWVLHHNTDLWRGTAPINASNHGIWPTGGAWLCQHLWWHYEYSGDLDYLRDTAYPLIRGAAQFFTEALVEDPQTGWLISSPSNSPEQGGLVAGPTMDHQIIRGLYADCIHASEVLGIDEAFRETLRDQLDRLAPNRIGCHGQLQEWMEDKDDPNNHHRHISHLWGLHPGRDVTWFDTPELWQAARRSLELRGDGGTGWSMGWKINCWARLLDGDHAYLMLRNQLTPAHTFPNLFDSHPPFQIDGNFGAANGIAEMFVQSHINVPEEGPGAWRSGASGRLKRPTPSENRGPMPGTAHLLRTTPLIHLLPALPSAWADGEVAGLRTRGGFEVRLAWTDGALSSASIRSSRGGPCRVLCGERYVDLDTEAGQTYDLGPALRL